MEEAGLINEQGVHTVNTLSHELFRKTNVVSLAEQAHARA